MTTPPPNDRTPTLGQRTQLERIGSDVWKLVGMRATSSDPNYYALIERESGRIIHTLTAVMVGSLEHAGWIERDGTGDTWRWGYRITPAGIQARDRGWQE